jgi:hypothetical protein
MQKAADQAQEILSAIRAEQKPATTEE